MTKAVTKVLLRIWESMRNKGRALLDLMRTGVDEGRLMPKKIE